MNHQDVVNQLIGLVQELPEAKKLAGAAVTETTQLTGDLELDSLKVMDLIVAVEDHFDISVPINALAEVKTVGDLAVEIEKILGANA